MRGPILSVLLLSLVSCDLRTPLDPPVTAQLGSAFELRAGQEAVIEGTSLKLRFESVGSDSRCPVDVTCVWAGDATVRVTLSAGAEALRSLELHTGVEPRSIISLGHRVALDRLDPTRRSDGGIAEADYRALFRIETAP